MKFVTFRSKGKESVGILDNDRVIPVKDVLANKTGIMADTMLGFIRFADGPLIDGLREAIASGNFEGYSINGVQILAPVPYPQRDIICVGKNYPEHAQEVADTIKGHQSVPAKPIYFSKSAFPAIGTGEVIDPHRDVTAELDYEAELAVVIGKKCSCVSLSEVYDRIFGYTIINDVSARDLQREHEQWYRGKSLNSFCPMGPCIVHRSSIIHPVELDITCTVNGECRQSSNTRNMIFKIPRLISELSYGITLYPGDIVATGTPEGVGLGYKPPRFLKSGDKVVCRVDMIGELINTVL